MAWVEQAIAEDTRPLQAHKLDWADTVEAEVSHFISEASRTMCGPVDTQAVEPFSADALQTTNTSLLNSTAASQSIYLSRLHDPVGIPGAPTLARNSLQLARMRAVPPAEVPNASQLTPWQWLQSRGAIPAPGTTGMTELERALSDRLKPALSWGSLHRDLYLQRQRVLRKDCADENVLLREELHQLCSSLQNFHPHAHDTRVINLELRRRVAGVYELLERFNSQPLGPKSILKTKAAKTGRHITFNPSVVMGPSPVSRDHQQIMRMQSAWKV